MTTVIKTRTALPSLQFSSRLKLTDEQRTQLREAFAAATSASNPDTIGTGGSIRVSTAAKSSVEEALKMDRLTFSSLIGSRETISVPVCLRLQRVLGVELISEEMFRRSVESYLTHLQEAYW